MLREKYYIIAENPKIGLENALHKIEVNENSITNIGNIEVLELSNYVKAKAIHWKLVQPLGVNNPDTNYWYYILLNKTGFQEYKDLRDKQLFTLKDLMNSSKEKIDLNKLTIKKRLLYGGGVISGKKEDFDSAFNFWVNSVTKIINEKFDINADLFGGTYNPISLKTLEVLVGNACGSLSDYLNAENFVSAIEMDNNFKDSGCFFVETKEEFYLIDVFCP